MQIYQNGKALNLSKQQFVGQGGQGQIYAFQNTAYKIYFDPKQMIPVGKINELSSLSMPEIIAPYEILTDKKGNPLGYTMRFLRDGIALCQLFPRSYRDRMNITPDMIIHLIKKLQEIITHCHQHNILIVDVNEMNFLVNPAHTEVYAIDVDSYQTPNYPATAIMDSIRDWQTKTFSTLTDWFSFAILSFQLFTGVHPFRGKYKGSDDQYKKKMPTDSPDDAFAITRRRMMHNISVFHKDVGIPGAAYPLDVIPLSFRAWYEDLFIQGKRSLPPDSIDTKKPTTIQVQIMAGSEHLIVKELGIFEGNITYVCERKNKTIVITDQGVWVDQHRIPNSARAGYHCYPAFSKFPTANPLFCLFDPKLYKLDILDIHSGQPEPVHFDLRTNELMIYDGRIYIKNIDKVLELILQDTSTSILATTQMVCMVLEHATKLYQGVVLQNLLGATYVSIFPQSCKTYQLHLKELDEYRIVDAKFDSPVLMVIGQKSGQYDRMVFRFDKDFQTYDARTIKNIPFVGLNFVTLDKGVCICLNEDEQLEIFSIYKDSTQIKLIQDPFISGDLKLFKQTEKLVAAKGNKLFQLSTK